MNLENTTRTDPAYDAIPTTGKAHFPLPSRIRESDAFEFGSSEVAGILVTAASLLTVATVGVFKSVVYLRDLRKS